MQEQILSINMKETRKIGPTICHKILFFLVADTTKLFNEQISKKIKRLFKETEVKKKKVFNTEQQKKNRTNNYTITYFFNVLCFHGTINFI